MKKLIFILALVVVAITANAQRTISDVIEGAETVNFTAMAGANYIQVLCEDNYGGTSDGLIMLQGSVDGVSYDDLFTNDNYWFSSIANDSLTIADNVTWVVDVSKLNFPYYRITGDGTSGDTTLITIKWSK
jgi:hypothetical protein